MVPTNQSTDVASPDFSRYRNLAYVPRYLVWVAPLDRCSSPHVKRFGRAYALSTDPSGTGKHVQSELDLLVARARQLSRPHLKLRIVSLEGQE